MKAPEFDIDFCRQLDGLLRWRRDVRHFRPDPVSAELVNSLLEKAMWAPSVGFSQPWRWVVVESEEKREAVRREFEKCNTDALCGYSGETASQYSKLKLSGLKEAPVQVAVFVDTQSGTGKGLGQQTMPETRTWSVVMAIHTLWLAAQAVGLGMGWVSILQPESIRSLLEAHQDWRFVAYLCIGRPEEECEKPLLERVGWEAKLPCEEVVYRR
jgi:5,6-dimethylbenzimidazole synthase